MDNAKSTKMKKHMSEVEKKLAEKRKKKKPLTLADVRKNLAERWEKEKARRKEILSKKLQKSEK